MRVQHAYTAMQMDDTLIGCGFVGPKCLRDNPVLPAGITYDAGMKQQHVSHLIAALAAWGGPEEHNCNS